VRVVRVEPEVPLPPLPRPPRRRGPIIAAASICAVAVGAAVVLLVSSRGASSTAVPVRLSSIAVIDAGSGKVVADDPIPVGSSPAPLVFGDGALWTYNESRQTVIRIEPRTGRYVERGTGVVPTDLAVGGGFEWLADGID